MPGGPKKVSFVLQFTQTQGKAEPWRGALREVESGERVAFHTWQGLLTSLSRHGVTLGDPIVCPECDTPLGPKGDG